MYTAGKELIAAPCSDRKPRARRAHALVALAVWATTGAAALAQPSHDAPRWLLYWTAARPSRAAQFEAQHQIDASALTSPLLTFRTDAFSYAFFTPLRAGEGREASYRLGPPAPTPPDAATLAPWAASAKTWLLETRGGEAPSIDPGDRPAHVGLWLVEPSASDLAVDLLRAWDAGIRDKHPASTVWTLEATEGPDQPLWATVVVGERAHDAGAELATMLAPVLRAALPSGAVLRAALSHRPAGDEPASPAMVAEPIEPLPLATAEQASAETTRAAVRNAPPAQQSPLGLRVANAARESVQHGPRYDTGYAVIAYPGGDPGWALGNSADLLIRSLRAVGIDLQKLVHEDLVRAPQSYGVVGRKLDTNIDHRRLRNLITFFERHLERLPTGLDAEWRAGDIVVWDVHGHARAEHLGVVTEQGGATPWVVHHFPPEPPFTGTPAEEQVLDFWPRTGHYRVDPDRLRASSP